MYRTLIVPRNGSAFGENALDAAGEITRRDVIGSVADKVLRGGPAAVLAVRPRHD